MSNKSSTTIDIDWNHYLKTGIFKNKGDPDPLPLLNNKTIDDFYLLCKTDKKIEEQYKFPEIFEKVSKLFDGDEVKARRWLLEKNSYFFNNSPLEVALYRKSGSLLKFLDERLGNEQKR